MTTETGYLKGIDSLKFKNSGSGLFVAAAILYFEKY
jgi:hypothetical protein